MKITDIFIRRPVLATVVSLLILVLGLRSMGLLPIRQFPFTENAIITVTTYYIGADPATVAGFITTPLENSIAQASGIDYMTSTSNQNVSTITVNLLLNYDSNAALSDINSKINAVLNQLPPASQQPSMSISISETIDSMYIAFYSEVLANNQITDYLVRAVQPKLQAINGVQNAQILGQQLLAMRIWLDPLKMSALGVSAADVSSALTANDFISASGRTDGNMITINLTATTGLHTVEQFENLIIKAQNNAIVRIRDVAKVTLGAQNYNTSVSFDTKDAIYIGIQVAPKANLLTVIKAIRDLFPSIQQQLPQGLKGRIVYDATAYVHSSIREVVKSLVEALVIVTIVIFLFLGSIRSVVIPSVTIPLSLIGAFFAMLLMHFSINLLSLLALVLAIGLVVDDAIIVVENVERHIEDGMKPLDAALLGARELANPILAITVVLVAVYLPIGFMGGLTGALFTEFAFTLAGAVTISAIIALTLSPMMCSKMLKPKINHDGKTKFMKWIDRQFERLRTSYERTLNHTLNFLPVTIVFAALILSSIYFLYATSKSELAPMEDQGVIITQLTAAPNASLGQTMLFSTPMAKNFLAWPEVDHTFQLDGSNGFNSSIVGGVLKPWDQRSKTEMELVPYAQHQLNDIAGVKAAAFELPPLPGGGSGLPVQFVIQTANPFESLNDIAQNIIKEAWKSGEFMYLDSDLKIDKQQVTLELDRDKISQMGLTMQQVGNVLSSSLSENYLNYFSLDGRSYQVIPQTVRMQRLNFNQLLNYYIRTASGMVPLSTVVKFHSEVVPEVINHFQQLNSATISAIMAPGVTQGQALDTLNAIAKRQLTPEYSVNYASQSRQYIQEGNALIVTFFFALLIIYLALAALFESFRDPLIVLISVPMSICGAMIFVSMGIGGASLNIYTEVGLVTLIGLISKHGILIVQFANDTQLEGKNKREAVEIAAGIRFRPILMTTAAMVLGVIPLITATGAGAVSRFNIGLVIATGIAIGTLFTLFVVPAMYLLLAEDIRPQEATNLPAVPSS
jgi:multidrug efflux pump